MSRVPLIAVCMVMVVGALDGCSSSDEPKTAAPSAEQARAALAGSPPALAKLHAQANQLLDGGPEAFQRRLAELEGHPVVVNKWGSWCGPCRAEFPFFQRQSVEHGKRVAFLGIDGNDNEANAKGFLRKLPVSFPSYVDPDLKIAAKVKAVAAFPSTVFFDRSGEIVYVKQGSYLKEQQLAADIERYAR